MTLQAADSLTSGDDSSGGWLPKTQGSTGRAWDSSVCVLGDPLSFRHDIKTTNRMFWKVHLTSKEGQSHSPGMTDSEVGVDWGWRTKGTQVTRESVTGEGSRHLGFLKNRFLTIDK